MKIVEVNVADLDRTDYELVMAANRVMHNAYNVYSSFCVGAAVYTAKGNIYLSANMENASYGLTVCAETGAIQAAFSSGDYKIKKIAITGHGVDSSEEQVITPCGRCRQLIAEAGVISGDDIELILCSADLKKIVRAKISTLLPMPFLPDRQKQGDIIQRFQNK